MKDSANSREIKAYEKDVSVAAKTKAGTREQKFLSGDLRKLVCLRIYMRQYASSPRKD